MKKNLLLLASFSLFSLFFFMVEGEKFNKLDIHLNGESFFEGLRIVQKKDGVPIWILTAKLANISKDGIEADLTGVEMVIKKEGTTIQAEKGLYNMNTRKISIEGAMTAKNNNYSITASQVEIDSAKALLTTNKDVHIEGNKFILEGKGMEIRNNEQEVRILNNVKATFNN